MSALRQRMIEDMQVRNYSPRTVEAYVAAVAKVAKHFGRSPDQLTGEDVRAFQVHLLEKKTSWSQFNQIVAGLRFFFGITLARPGMVEMLPYGKRPSRQRESRLRMARKLLLPKLALSAGVSVSIASAESPRCPACGSVRLTRGELLPRLKSSPFACGLPKGAATVSSVDTS